MTPWTVAYSAPLSMEFSRQESWRGLRNPSSGDLPDPGIKLRSPTLHADSLPSEPQGKPWHQSRSLPSEQGHSGQRHLPKGTEVRNTWCIWSNSNGISWSSGCKVSLFNNSGHTELPKVESHMNYFAPNSMLRRRPLLNMWCILTDCIYSGDKQRSAQSSTDNK